MGKFKAPGLDGFAAAFFSKSLACGQRRRLQCGRIFFLGGKLFRQVNHMLMALIPKVNVDPINV